MKTRCTPALAVVLLVVSASLAQAEDTVMGSVIWVGDVSLATTKDGPGSKDGVNSKNAAPISTTRSNKKHAAPQQPSPVPTCQPGKTC